MLAFALFLFVVCGSPLAAAPESDNDVDPTIEQPSEPAAKRDTDAKSAPVDDESVKPAHPATSPETDDEIDRLERAIEGMRSAQKRISAADTSEETQKIQEQVIKDLQTILVMLKKQQNRQSQSQSQKRDQNQQPSERQKMQKDQTDPQNSGPRKNQDKSGDPQDGRRNDGKSADSQERTDAARAAKAEQARRAQLVKDVWGHLPPHVREAMLNSMSEKYLPKYEELVKKYYEALAQKTKTENRKKTGK